MNKHNDNQNDNHKVSQFTTTEPAPQSVDHGRRNFTRAGLIVSGAIVTLKSAPVLAGNKGAFPGTPTNIQYRECESPSGFTSMNVSAPGKTQPSCGGLSPGGWKAWPSFWPYGYIPGTCNVTKNNSTNNQVDNCNSWDPQTGTPFHSGIVGTLAKPRSYPAGFPGFSGNVFGDKSLMGVMHLNGNADPARLGMHCVASILNVAKGLVPETVLTIPVILNMWTATSGGGYYEPTAGVKWYAEDVVNFLASTFGEN